MVVSEATQGIKASAVADKKIAKPLSQGLLTKGLVVKKTLSTLSLRYTYIPTLLASAYPNLLKGYPCSV